MKKQWLFSSSTSKWLLLALICGICFLLYTAAYATGVLNHPTLEVERWLVGRPQTQLDCVFYEWRRLGTVPVSLVFLVLVCGICLLAGYSWRVMPVLLLLFLLGTGAEVVGKKLFDLPLPLSLRSGMTTLTCPQIEGQSLSTQIKVGVGMWWVVPPASQEKQNLALNVSQMPLQPAEPGSSENGYPSGHALRWFFLGIIGSWLLQKHLRRKWLGGSLATLLLLFTFVGAWIQFYVGAHFVSDTLAGTFLGIALAALSIALLIMSDKRRGPSANREDWMQASTMKLPNREHTSAGTVTSTMDI